MLTQSVLLPIQTKVEDGGANESDDDTDPNMVPLINLVADAESLLLHLVASQCSIAVVDVILTLCIVFVVKLADTLVFAAVDVGSNESTECSCGTTAAAADGRAGRVEGVVGGCVWVLPGTSTGGLERAMFCRTQITWHGQVELKVDCVGCAFGRDTALFAYDRCVCTVGKDDVLCVCMFGQR